MRGGCPGGDPCCSPIPLTLLLLLLLLLLLSRYRLAKLTLLSTFYNVHLNTDYVFDTLMQPAFWFVDGFTLILGPVFVALVRLLLLLLLRYYRYYFYLYNLFVYCSCYYYYNHCY